MRIPATFALLLALAGPTAGEGERPTFAAEVLALHDARVPAEVPGRVVRRPDDETLAVKAGDIVVALDDALLAPAARSARAAAQRAEARREWAELEWKRVQALFERGSVGQAELDSARLAMREAVAGQLAAAAAAEEVEARLARTKIRAPFDGRLVRVYPQLGEFLAVGQTAFRVVDDSRLRIVAYLSARDLRRTGIAAGDRALVRADFEPASASPLEARVFSVAPAAEGNSRTFRVEARLARPEKGRLRPGMAALLTLAPGD